MCSNNITKIEETINKWFDETHKNFIERGAVSKFLLSVFLAAKKYILSSLLLVKNGHKMPTKALLRILAEVFIKFEWCMCVYEKNRTKKKMEERISRWWKTTICYRIRELSKWENVQIESLKEQAKEQKLQLQKLYEEEWEDDSIKLLPKSLIALIENELPSDIINDIYPRFYLKYNDSIHLDIASLGFLVREREGRVEIQGDSPEEEKEFLEGIIFYVASINGQIRTYYGWDNNQLYDEREALLKTL